MGKKDAPFYDNVSSKYGAPMGRRSCKPSELAGKVHLARVPMVDGAYDPGGAYWGGPETSQGLRHLFCLWDDDGNVLYTRGVSREAVRQEYQGQISGRFYR